ncbi:unnamed protein product [Arabidopsis lyrata]|nr:unnamed protein product [Arabidopsis lyrata]
MERSCHVVLGGSRLRGRRCLRTALNPASFLRWLLMVGSPSRRAMWNSTENLSVGGRSPHIRAYRNLIGGFRSVSNGIDEDQISRLNQENGSLKQNLTSKRLEPTFPGDHQTSSTLSRTLQIC